MKSKKLVVILCVLMFLTVLIVLNSTLFTLQSISVNWLTTKYELNGLKDTQIIDNVDKGESIFLVNKNEIISKLEKQYPYLRVVSIETKFPNKIVIHSAEREGLFAVKLADDEYAVMDGLGKVLKFTTSSVFAGNDLGTKPIKLEFDNISINPEQFVVGENVKETRIINLVNKLSKTLLESGYSPTTSKGVFTSINVNSMSDNSEISMQSRNGMVIRLNRADDFMTDKFLLGLKLYNTWQQEGVVTGVVDVWHDLNDNKIYAEYKEIVES